MIQRSHLILMLLLLCTTVMAQNKARITTAQIQRGMPEVTMTLHVLCNGQPVYNLSNSQLSITDNGMPVEDVTIVESSSALARYPVSVALVLDASGSMIGAGNAGAKAAGHDFVDFLDGVWDESAVLWFTSNVTVQQQMTSDTSLLHSAVDSLPAIGATAVWDGTLRGVDEVSTSGTNQKRSVLVLTDGGDNSSTTQPSQIITRANQLGIRVFAVGLGSSINATELQLIAQLAGGLYFETPNASQLQQIFTDIASFIGRSYDEHTISFRTPDPNAASHKIQISVASCNEALPASYTLNNLNGMSVGDTPELRPFTLRLEQNVPNPVTNSTSIPFSLETTSSPQPVLLEVFDILGRKVATLVDETIAAGNYAVPFTPTTLSQGMYVIRLSSGAVTETRTMLLQR